MAVPLYACAYVFWGCQFLKTPSNTFQKGRWEPSFPLSVSSLFRFELKGEARINKNWHHNITGIKCGSSYTYIMPMSLLRRNDHREIRFYWVHADSIHPFPLYFKLHGNTNLGLLCTVRDRVRWRLFLGYLWFFEVEVVKMVVHQFRLVSDEHIVFISSLAFKQSKLTAVFLDNFEI